MKTIGIPRALFYYYQYPLWANFLRFLGFKVVLSPETNKKIVDKGIRYSVDEACFPIKVALGHIYFLKDQVDFVFLPRIISVQEKTFLCPKFMGLPDMVKSSGILPKEKLLSPIIDIRKKPTNYFKEFFSLGSSLGKKGQTIKNAWLEGKKAQLLFQSLCQKNFLPDQAIKKIENRSNIRPQIGSESIAILGHGYNIYDKYMSLGLIDKISLRYKVVTADMLPEDVIKKNVAYLPKKMFWSLGQKMLGGANYFLNDQTIKGIIYLCSFGCGPDSLVGDLIERKIQRAGKKPFMLLTIDEHSGEAGIQTRIEAFLDMIERKDAI